MEESIIKETENFYSDLNIFFRTSGKDIHHGLWYDDTKSQKEACLNSNKLAAQLLDAGNGDKILDAGCGYGGTSIYLAKNHGSDMTGINIVPVQIEQAEKFAKKASLTGKIKFFVKSYLDTGFDDATFDKICAIESVCYAVDKSLFLKESYRLLKKGGRLVIFDPFLVRDNLNIEENEVFNKFCSTYNVTRFGYQKEFEEQMKQTGFKNIVFHERFNNWIKSADTYFLEAIFMYPLVWFLSRFNIVSKKALQMGSGMLKQKNLAKYDFLTYGAYVAYK